MIDANGDMIYRPRPLPSYFSFAAGLAFLAVYVFEPHKLRKDPLFISMGMFAVSVVLLLIFRQMSITISSQGLIARSLFGTKEISWTSVSKSWIERVHRGKYRRLYWNFQTVDQRRLQVSVKFYSMQCLQSIARALMARNASSIADDKIPQLAEGKRPWRW